MMNRAFADTSFYVALLLARDENHAKAVDLAKADLGRIVTTEYVLVELGNFLAAASERRLFVNIASRLENDPATTIVRASRLLYRQGLQLYGRRADKAWSLTDCISFGVMRSRRIDHALTADRHFAQAGFRALMR